MFSPLEMLPRNEEMHQNADVFSSSSFNNGMVCATLLQLFMLIRETENVQKHRRACHFAPGILMSLEMPKFGGGGARRNGAARVVY